MCVCSILVASFVGVPLSRQSVAGLFVSRVATRCYDRCWKHPRKCNKSSCPGPVKNATRSSKRAVTRQVKPQL